MTHERQRAADFTLTQILPTVPGAGSTWKFEFNTDSGQLFTQDLLEDGDIKSENFTSHSVFVLKLLPYLKVRKLILEGGYTLEEV